MIVDEVGVSGALPAISVTGRVERLREALSVAGAPATFVATDRADVRWLTGFSGSAGSVVVTSDDVVLVTDTRYGERARAELAAVGSTATVEAVLSRDVSDRIATVAGADFGVDPAAVAWSQATAWAELTGIVAVPSPVLDLRQIKDAAEVARIARSAAIADAALRQVAPELVVGAREIDIARRLERTMEDLGADGPGYPTIVASGPQAALPHAESGSRRFAHGDTVIIDVGASVDGYRSDMTRTFVIGGEPDAETQGWLDAVDLAAAVARDAVAPGAVGTDLHRRSVAALEESNLGDRFIHGLGHGVGLVIHEPPFLTYSDAPLAVGQVITIEPGVYVPGRGGVRWEDLLVVTEDGHEVLTRSAKEPDPRRFSSAG